MPKDVRLMGTEHRIREGAQPPSLGAGKPPRQPHQLCPIDQGDARQMARDGASPVADIVPVPAQELPRPVATSVMVLSFFAVRKEQAKRLRTRILRGGAHAEHLS